MTARACRNDVEVCVASLRRSGHHAVLNWIEEQLPGPALRLNNLVVGEDPVETRLRRLRRDGRAPGADRVLRELRDPAPVRLLLVNYEDTDLRLVFSDAETRRREAALGPSRRRVNVLVLRDHLNLFASRLRRVRLGSTDPREDLGNALLARRLYVQYARELLGETNRLGPGAVAISFNRWFADEGYRREISARLGGRYAEATLDRLAAEGEGSSFDGDRYRDRAREMDVLGRFREMEGNLLFHAVAGERRLLRYTERIFGPMGYEGGRPLLNLAAGLARPACSALDRLLKGLSRHDGRP